MGTEPPAKACRKVVVRTARRTREIGICMALGASARIQVTVVSWIDLAPLVGKRQLLSSARRRGIRLWSELGFKTYLW